MRKEFARFTSTSLLFPSTTTVYAGIDYSKNGNGPTLFLGWETSFYFAIATILLFGISWILTDSFKEKDGVSEGRMGYVVGLINIAMIICAICSFYLLIPLGIIYILIKSNKK